jgi:hypothetical protein
MGHQKVKFIFLWILSENLFRYWQNATFTFFLGGKSSKAPYVGLFLSFIKRIPFSGPKLHSSGARGGLQIFLFNGILIFLLLRSPCKISESYDNPLCAKM